MKKYFYSDGTDSFGPFTIEELKEKGIGRDTNVWFQELGEWKRAELVEELSSLFQFNTPPPPPQFKAPIINSTTNVKSSIYDKLVLGTLAYWCIINFATALSEYLVPEWYDSPIKYIRIVTNIIFSIAPMLFAISVRDKSLKIISIILGVLVSIFILYNNIQWLIREIGF